MQEKIKPEELKERADMDYYGFRDEDDGELLAYEASKEQMEIDRYLPTCPNDRVAENFILELDIPSQQEVEEWLVSKRRAELEQRFLNARTLDQETVIE
jgi:hypothetical protein